jgi:c-di-GMP-binding flagellar brake protein YcgR
MVLKGCQFSCYRSNPAVFCANPVADDNGLDIFFEGRISRKQRGNKGVKNYHADRYQLLTVKDPQKDEAAIIEVLSAIMADELSNDLVLLNYYNEIPVSFGASIERIERGVVDITVHRLQFVAMRMQRMTFIKSEHLPYCVIAKVLKVKKEESLALLTQFSYVNISSEQRMYVRVKIQGRVEVVFNSDKQEVRGTISDISYGGVAIQAPQAIEIKQNARGMVTLCLPAAKLEIPGTFLRVDELQGSHKYIIQLETDPKSEKIISHFIFQEQIEILRELKDMCV